MELTKAELLEARAYLDKSGLRIPATCGLIYAPRDGEGKLSFSVCSQQICHSSIGHDIKMTGKFVDLAFSVVMAPEISKGLLTGHYSRSYYVYNAWLAYLMFYSPFAYVFTTASGLGVISCLAQGLIPVDLDKAPANVTMAAMMCIRHLWEQGIKAWPERFITLRNFGVNEDLAFLLAPFITVDEADGKMTFSTIEGNTNHMVFVPSAIGLDYVKNYMDHNWTHFADKTITMGGDYFDGVSKNTIGSITEPRWNCYSLFADKVIKPHEAMSKRDGEWMVMLKEIFDRWPRGMFLGDLTHELQKVIPSLRVGKHQ